MLVQTKCRYHSGYLCPDPLPGICAEGGCYNELPQGNLSRPNFYFVVVGNARKWVKRNWWFALCMITTIVNLSMMGWVQPLAFILGIVVGYVKRSENGSA